MKIGFYSPYLPDSSVGGGEKHLFDMASVLAEEHQVFILIKSSAAQNLNSIKQKYQEFFETDLSNVRFISAPLGPDAGPLQKLIFTRQFDYFFYWTDGSLFFSMAKRNNLHLQIPFTVSKNGFIDKLKLSNWKLKNANSEFTKRTIEEAWKTDVPYVIHPMVELSKFDPGAKKEKTILNVGRFFRQQHSKRQDVLVETFKQMVDSHKFMKNWNLQLVGTVEDESYAKEIAAAAKGYNIELLHEVPRTELTKLYNQASIYWHATGFGVDQARHPEKMEHFGITTIEAMAAGVVPVVINKGGQPEILGEQLSSNLWNDIDELMAKTVHLAKSPKLLAQQSRIAVKSAGKYSKENFTLQVKKMIRETTT